MNYECLFLEAVEAVLAQDLPDEVFPEALEAQFHLMAGLPPEEPDWRD